MEPELRTYLVRELCEDVVRVIEEYVVGQSRRVSRAFKAIVKNVEWRSPNTREVWFGNVSKVIVCCEDCGIVNYINFTKNNKYLLTINFWECGMGGSCGDGKLPPRGKDYLRLEGNSFKIGYPGYLWYTTLRINFEFFGREKWIQN